MAKTVKVIPATINPITHMPSLSVARKKVAAYARVSTGSEEQATSYKAQCNYYTEYIKSKPEWEYVDTYADEAISGLNIKNRPGFQKMIADAFEGKIDLIITKSVSRFARNTVDSLVTIRELKARNIEVYFEEQNIYTLDSKGELLLTIMASIAQEESRNISQNITWGHQRSMQSGNVHFAYSNFLGYYKDYDSGKILIDEEQAKIVHFIYEQFMRGKTSSGICKILTEANIPTPMGKTEWRKSTVDSILTNEKYKGDAILQKYYTVDYLQKKMAKNKGERKQYSVIDSHPAIIDKEEWEQVQAEFLRRKNLGAKYSSTNIFSSKLICGECGGFYGPKVWHHNSKYEKIIYRCNDKYSGESKCNTPVLTEDDIKTAFMKAYNEFIINKEAIIEDCNLMINIATDTTELETKIDELEIERTVIAKKAEDLINENKKGAKSQEEYTKKYNELDEAFKHKTNEIEKLSEEITIRKAKDKNMRSFIENLKTKPNKILGWNDDIWIYLVEKGIVNLDGSITFVFRNGTEITSK